MSTAYRVDGIQPVGCLDHADIVLRCQDSGASLRVRVEASLARAALAETASVPSEFATFIDIVKVLVEGKGARLVGVTVDLGDEPDAASTGAILWDSGDGPVGVGGLPAGISLVFAARIGIPVRLGRPGSAVDSRPFSLPPAVEAFLAGLPLDGLGDA